MLLMHVTCGIFRTWEGAEPWCGTNAGDHVRSVGGAEIGDLRRLTPRHNGKVWGQAERGAQPCSPKGRGLFWGVPMSLIELFQGPASPIAAVQGQYLLQGQHFAAGTAVAEGCTTLRSAVYPSKRADWSWLRHRDLVSNIA